MDVETLINEWRNNLWEIIMNFLHIHSNHKDDLVCFYEGYDYPYYNLRLNKYYTWWEFHSIQCQWKNKVLEMFKWINKDWSYNKSKIAFFVDKDFDKSIKWRYANIYETPCYSIENLYCWIDSLKQILIHKFNIYAHSTNYNAILAKYLELEEQFLEKSLCFNAWYKIQKNKWNKKISISNLSIIPKYIDISFNGIIKKYNESDLCIDYPEYISYIPNELSISEQELRKLWLIYSLRWKFNLKFFLKFIELLVMDSKNKKTYIKKPVIFNIDWTEKLSILWAFSITPPCLIDFIKQYN